MVTGALIFLSFIVAKTYLINVSTYYFANWTSGSLLDFIWYYIASNSGIHYTYDPSSLI